MTISGRIPVVGRLSFPSNPQQIPNLVQWLRSDLGVNLASDGVHVQSWLDQSGLGVAFVQNVTANQVSYVSGVYNGKPALRSPDAARWMQAAVSNNYAPMSFGLVFSKSTLASSYIASTSGGGDNAVLDNFTTTLVEWFNNSGADRDTFASAPAVGLHQLIVTQTDSVSLVGYFDGAQVFSVVPTATINSSLNVLFGYGAGANGTNGDIVEFFQYNRQITPVEVVALHSYSQRTWGTP